MKSRQELLDGFSDEEKSRIMASPGAETLEDVTLFARCAPYFRNGYNVEEIMYWENLRRFQILSTVDKFRDILVIEEREDPKIFDYFRRASLTSGY